MIGDEIKISVFYKRSIFFPVLTQKLIHFQLYIGVGKPSSILYNITFKEIF